MQSTGAATGVGTVAIVDRYDILARTAATVLEHEGFRCHVVSLTQASTVEDLVSAITSLQPDLVVCGLELIELDGESVPMRLSQRGMRVLTLSESTSPVRHGEALSRGAHAVLPKATATLEEFLDAVRLGVNGEPVLDDDERDRLIGLYRSQGSVSANEKFARLTKQEREVLARLVAGLNVRDISRLHHVEESTVRTQVKSILSKLNVTSQLAAVALCRQVEWIPPAN